METTRTIERYLEGTLKEEERQAVEDRAERDTDFRELIRLHQEVNASIGDTNLSMFNDLIKKISGEYFTSSGAVIKDHVRKPYAALYRFLFRSAAVLILVAIAGVILKLTLLKGMSSSEIYKKYYAVYDADVINRSAQTVGTPLDKAIMSYDAGRYSEALEIFDAITEKDHDNYLALFYRGLACMETGEMDRAVLSFRNIPDKWNSAFKEHRDWYLALSLLNSHHESEAAEIFHRISTGKSYYAERADIILKKLKL